MKYQYCKFGSKCKYFHPKGLNKVKKKEKNANLKVHEGNETYANIVKKSLQQQQVHSNGPFLGLTQPVYQTEQVHLVQHQPCLGQPNHTQQALLEIQRSQKQMMDLFLNLNQIVMNMFSPQIQS